MKIVDVVGFIPFYDKIKDQSMPITLAYKLSKIYNKAKEEETFYHTELRNILMKYGELDENGNLIIIEDGNGVKIKPDKQQECLDAIMKLQAIESKVEFETLTLEELDKLELTPADIDNVLGFIN